MTSSTDGDSTERDGHVAGLVGSSTHATSDINPQLKVRMGDVPLFRAPLRPSPHPGRTPYAFHVAGPINWSYVLIPILRATSPTAGLLWQDTVGILLCDRAWHYDINWPRNLDGAGAHRQ